MHLPGCFLLTRLFQGHPFYRAAWCCSKVFQVSPLPPTTFTIRPQCTAGTLFFFSVKQGGNSCLRYKAKTPRFRCPCHITGDAVWEREMSYPIVLCSWFCLDCMWEDSLHMVEHISNADHPFSFPWWFLFYCSFTNLWQWRLHYSKMVCILAYSLAVRPLYHSDGLVKSRLVDSKCFLSDQQVTVPVKDKKTEVP